MKIAVSYQRRWQVTATILLFLLLLPVAFVISYGLGPAGEHFEHFLYHLLPDSLLDTLALLVGVTVLTSIIGVSLAWLTAMAEFPGRILLSWALLAPLAVPRYVMGFVYMGIFDPSGPLPPSIDLFGWKVFWDFRSYWGLIFVMALALYPYVYIMTRVAFQTIGSQSFEAARSLGWNPTKIFFKLALPLVTPWWFGGLVLVNMEVLADFGTVSMFSYDTFSTVIYKAWYGFFSPQLAARLAAILVVLLLVFFWAKFMLERRRRYNPMGNGDHNPTPFFQLPVWAKAGALAWSLLILSLGIIVPVIQLIIWGTKAGFHIEWRYLGNSLFFAALTTAIAVIVAFLLVISGRFDRGGWGKICNQLAAIGYSLPGSILAIGVFSGAVWMERVFGSIFKYWDWKISGVLTGSLGLLVFGLVARFTAVAHAPIDNGLKRLSKNLDEVGIMHGFRGFRAVRKVHIPLLWKSIVTAGMLVFVETLKEMPLVLMTRPFGWDTLSVKIFELTSEGLWQQAAVPSLVLLLFGFLPVVVLATGVDRR